MVFHRSRAKSKYFVRALPARPFTTPWTIPNRVIGNRYVPVAICHVFVPVIGIDSFLEKSFGAKGIDREFVNLLFAQIYDSISFSQRIETNNGYRSTCGKHPHRAI